MRKINLNRDEADLLVDLLEGKEGAFSAKEDIRLLWLANEIREKFGMAHQGPIFHDRGCTSSDYTLCKRPAGR